MKERALRIEGILVTVFLIVTLMGTSIISIGSNSVINNHPQPGIWEYENLNSKPSSALVLQMEQEHWQYTTSACIVPAYINRYEKTPILFDDGSDEITIEIPHETKTVTSFGADIITATANMAKAYWTKAEIVVVAETYEEVLWVVPIASFLSSPILVNPTSATLQDLGTQCAIVVGGNEPDVGKIIELGSKEGIWEFQLELFNTKGQECNYVIITNPHDTADALNPNIKWPYVSLASAPLAAHRKALVQTGDWTTDKSKIEGLELRTSKDDVLYNEVKPKFEKVREDSLAAENFLLGHSHTPEYLAVVGGPYAIPNYFYDIMVNYKYPLGNTQVTIYPSSIGPYATLSDTISNDQYKKEDLASGRILTTSVFDATRQLMKTFFYKEYLPGGVYNSVIPGNWEETASVVDGHRLNQPEPNNLIWDPEVPYHPARPVKEVFENASFDTTYHLPRNESDPFDHNKTIFEIMKITTNSSLVQLLPHGGKTSLRIEIGVEPITTELKSTYLTGENVRDLDFKAPTIVYTGCCKGANSFMLDEGVGIKDFVTPGFIHAGCVAYIATPEIQSTCFWREAPFGVSTQQNIYMWEKLLESNITLGKALRDAKWDAHEWAYAQWPNDAANNLTFEIDCIVYNLFGDPALEPFKPDVPFDSKEEMDVQINYEVVEDDGKLNVEVEVADLSTSQTISDAQITIKFNGATKTGSTATFEISENEGEYVIEVSVSKAGYNDLSASYITSVKEVEGEDNLTPLLVIIFIIIGAIVLVFIIKSRKKYRESE